MVRLKNRDKEIDVDDIIQKSISQTSKTMQDALDTAVEKKLSQKLREIKDTRDQTDNQLVDCPNCSSNSNNGHSHKLQHIGKGTLKCSGPECKSEYLIIPKSHAEYVCESCGQPHIKIDTRNKDIRKNDKCVNCDGIRFKPIK